ncbi:MAG TPA: hypothetical protein VGL08_09865 [Paraburkholderia sp.]|jgi:hypothetical protein
MRLSSIAAVCALSLFSTVCAAQGNKPITSGNAQIVRGVNPTSCDAANIGTGNNPPVGPRGDLDNLSVSCTDDPRVTVTELRENLPNPHACVATLSSLRSARRDVLLVRDPTNDNPYHCQLSTITPNQFVSGAKFRN